MHFGKSTLLGSSTSSQLKEDSLLQSLLNSLVLKEDGELETDFKIDKVFVTGTKMDEQVVEELFELVLV